MKRFPILNLAKHLTHTGMVTGMLLSVGNAQAQTPPPHIQDEVSYQAWKEQFVTPQQVVTNDDPEFPAELRGGPATCDCWVQPDASYTTIDNDTDWDASGWSSSDDGSYGPITLPFNFYLYGQYWTEAFININGNVSFGEYFGTFSSTGFPVSGYTMVAPFWADVDLGGTGVNNNIVQYKITPTALYVNWTNVGYFNEQTDKLNTFQLIITDGTDPAIQNGANVSFCYKDMQWTTGGASGGNGGFGGTAASVGANQGNGTDYIQFGRFDHEGIDYDGPFGAVDGVSWLDDKYFTFATSVTTGNVPPVITGQSVCDSLTVCSDQIVNLDVLFLSPEPDQTTVPTSYAPTLSNYTIVSQNSGVNADITTQFTPTAADLGYHDIFFEGTDNGNPVMTSVLKIVLNVLPSPQIESGALTVCDDAGPVNMYAALGGTPAPGGEWVGPNGQPHSGTFIPGVDADGPYLYSVDIGGTCFASGTVTMTSVAHSDAGDDATLAYCSSTDPFDLFMVLSGDPHADGTWRMPDGTVFDGTLVPETMPTGVYTYLLEAALPCLNDTAFLTITIPQAVDAGVDTSVAICRSEQVQPLFDLLGGTPDTGGNWSQPGGLSFNGTVDPATAASGTYTYTVPTDLPCPTMTALMEVHFEPVPYSGTDGSIVLCANDPQLALIGVLGDGPDTDGHWIDPLDSAHSGTLDPSLEVSGKYIYVTIGSGVCGHLSDTSLVNVLINTLPKIEFSVEPDSGCHPLEVVLTNITDPMYVGGGCIWTLGDGSATVENCNAIMHTYEEPGWYHVKLRMTTPQGCTDELVKPGAVLVQPAPQAMFIWTPEVGTPDQSNLTFTAIDPYAATFQWSFPGREELPTGRQVQHFFPHALSAEYEVCLSVQDRYGCADSLCQLVPVEVPSSFIPIAFTPNGDGVNDKLLVHGTGFKGEGFLFQAYDRWGHLVYETTNAGVEWDGQHRKGGMLPTGTYVWVMKAVPIGSAEELELNGYVNLLR